VEINLISKSCYELIIPGFSLATKTDSQLLIGFACVLPSVQSEQKCFFLCNNQNIPKTLHFVLINKLPMLINVLQHLI
jgi:hypothetical protein